MIALVVVALVAAGGWLAFVRPRAAVSAQPVAASRPASAGPAAPAPTTPAPTTPSPPPTPPSIAAPTPRGTVPSSTAPKPATPLGPVSLTGWKLTLPTASEKGTAASVTPASTSAPWLTRDGNGSLTFWAPVDGVTTPNSQHPRTELVSLSNFAAGGGPRTLSASLAVTQAPASNQDVIVGQIHGAEDISSVAFVMLHYSAGTIRVVVKQGQSGSASDKYQLITGVPLGARFSYTISDTGNGTVSFSASYGTTSRTMSIPLPEPFRNATVRFQAGAYQQGEATGAPRDGARVTFYSLREAATAAAR